MSEFVYLYRRQSIPTGSPQQMQERMQRWRAWFGVKRDMLRAEYDAGKEMAFSTDYPDAKRAIL
jgi:hypothetical protein